MVCPLVLPRSRCSSLGFQSPLDEALCAYITPKVAVSAVCVVSADVVGRNRAKRLENGRHQGHEGQFGAGDSTSGTPPPFGSRPRAHLRQLLRHAFYPFCVGCPIWGLDLGVAITGTGRGPSTPVGVCDKSNKRTPAEHQGGRATGEGAGAGGEAARIYA